MDRKQDAYYFNFFVECSLKSAELLLNITKDFDIKNLKAHLDEMHEIEHAADIKKHEIT